MKHNFPKQIRKDNANAEYVWKKLEKLGYKLRYPVDTNILWLDVNGKFKDGDELQIKLENHGIRIFGSKDSNVRLVFHLGIDKQACDLLISLLNCFFFFFSIIFSRHFFSGTAKRMSVDWKGRTHPNLLVLFDVDGYFTLMSSFLEV